MLTPTETSPLNLMQERYRGEPWALLVGCILFNMVRGSTARPILEKFLERWPDPEVLFGENEHALWTIPEMAKLFEPLGFQNRRADRIWKMTFDFLVVRPDLHPEKVKDLHGVGKYAADSFKMFYEGYIVEDVLDKELKSYVQWARGRIGTPVPAK